ncbi:unnamed protein product [Acanthoscelides obtectus]|uniref:Ig-like domain-containing protein n=1 Tax=Acanthoscelides obtectus TaxID=200917 RepID=A0A9P0KWQ4_ACAOB|nr:unnamed protein product [Acanthoscelides obtectus]CAK1635599.1 Down syndrome cell adhesion molecule [Acanthoscelides obtectus]
MRILLLRKEATSNKVNSKYLVLPSGELHIKDVGPEDGYKSYQCRTKHRLTGETRLSATKGRLVITEPVGTRVPKLLSNAKMVWFEDKAGEDLALLCQAQGYPPPIFRTVGYQETHPSIRCEEYNHRKAPWSWCFASMSSARVPSAHVQVRYIPFLEPVDVKTTLSMLSIGQRVKALHFYAKRKGYPFPDSEPVGSKAPAFSSDIKLLGYQKEHGATVSMLCPAQGYPSPMFRTHRFKSAYVFIYREKFNVRSKRGPRVCAVVPCPGTTYPEIQVRFFANAELHWSVAIQKVTFTEPTSNVSPKKVGAEFGGWRVVNVPKGAVAWLPCQNQPVTYRLKKMAKSSKVGRYSMYPAMVQLG